MKTCLQIGLTNALHAMVGEFKSREELEKHNQEQQVLFDVPMGILLPWSYQFFLIALIKNNYYETFRLYCIPNILSNLLVR